MKSMYVCALKRLQAYRTKCHLTQEEVGRIIGANQSQYSKMELGKTMLSYRALNSLHRSGWDVDYILTGYHFPEDSAVCGLLDNWEGKQQVGMKKLLLWSLENIPFMTDTQYNRIFKMEKTLLEKQLYNDSMSDHLQVMLRVRESLNYSQKDMALVMGVDIKKYRSMEWEDTMPDSELLFTLFNRTGCRPTVMMNGDVNGKWLLYYMDRQCDEQGRKYLREMLEFGAGIYNGEAALADEDRRKIMGK